MLEYIILFLHLSVTLASPGSRILDPFWASYSNQAINMKLFLSLTFDSGWQKKSFLIFNHTITNL